MPNFYVNIDTQSDGIHMIHGHNCRYLPPYNKRLYLGFFSDCKDAVKKAKEFYTQVKGCEFCSPKCSK